MFSVSTSISVFLVERIETSENTFHLNENQIRSLIDQIDMVNWTLLTSSLSFNQQQLPLVLYLDQLIELCSQQKIDINKLVDNETVPQNSSLFDHSKIKFSLSLSQIAHLINQNNFDIRKLIAIEQSLKEQDIQAQQFRLNASQLAYLFVNRHDIHDHAIVGLSVGQVIGLYMLQQQSTREDQTSLFSLTYQQIKQLALIQSKRSFRSSVINST